MTKAKRMNFIMDIIDRLPSGCPKEIKGVIFETSSKWISRVDNQLLELSKHIKSPEMLSAKINSFWSDIEKQGDN